MVRVDFRGIYTRDDITEMLAGKFADNGVHLMF